MTSFYQAVSIIDILVYRLSRIPPHKTWGTSFISRIANYNV